MTLIWPDVDVLPDPPKKPKAKARPVTPRKPRTRPTPLKLFIGNRK